MSLTHEEQRLIDEFKKLTPSCKDELLAFACSLASRCGADAAGESSDQCRLKSAETRPEAEKTPIFTE